MVFFAIAGALVLLVMGVAVLSCIGFALDNGRAW